MRGSYERKGLFRSPEAETLPSAERLTVPLDESGQARDIVPSRTPAYTMAVEELTMDQILTDIDRRGIHKVGIVATDPRDVIFLAREVNQFCGDVQLFTPHNNLLYAHPQYASDLRGMFIGTPYLLYPRNLVWSDSSPQAGDDAAHIYFASEVAQGAYNATLAQLREIGIKSAEPHLLEYSFPLTRSGLGKGVPAIWIGVVGHRGIYPVHAQTHYDEPVPVFGKNYRDLYQVKDRSQAIHSDPPWTFESDWHLVPKLAEKAARWVLDFFGPEPFDLRLVPPSEHESSGWRCQEPGCRGLRPERAPVPHLRRCRQRGREYR